MVELNTFLKLTVPALPVSESQERSRSQEETKEGGRYYSKIALEAKPLSPNFNIFYLCGFEQFILLLDTSMQKRDKNVPYQTWITEG